MQCRMMSPILKLLPFTTSTVTRLAEFGHLVNEDQALLVSQAIQVPIAYSHFYRNSSNFSTMLTISMPPFLVEAPRIICWRFGESFAWKFLSLLPPNPPPIFNPSLCHQALSENQTVMTSVA